jgi:DNA-binding NarL/FixJ family response regulator
MTHLLVADDHPLFRLALVQALQGLVDDVVISQADSLHQARVALAQSRDIDLVLLDLHLPDSHGLMGLASLRAEYPAVAVAMISAHDDPVTIRRALAYGAAAFIPKRTDLAAMREALHRVLAGERYLPAEMISAVDSLSPSAIDRDVAERLASLTPQQFKVLTRVAEGELNKQIADALRISERTVKAHLSALFEKLGVRNRTQAGVLLRTLELTDPSHQIEPD